MRSSSVSKIGSGESVGFVLNLIDSFCLFFEPYVEWVPDLLCLLAELFLELMFKLEIE